MARDANTWINRFRFQFHMGVFWLWWDPRCSCEKWSQSSPEITRNIDRWCHFNWSNHWIHQLSSRFSFRISSNHSTEFYNDFKAGWDVELELQIRVIFQFFQMMEKYPFPKFNITLRTVENEKLFNNVYSTLNSFRRKKVVRKLSSSWNNNDLLSTSGNQSYE